MPDYEILVLMLSALKWQQCNGPIRMITDTAGAEFLAANGLENLWSTRIETSLDGMSGDIDPFLFWAAGKLYALSRVRCPCVMLDTDMIIWRDLSSLYGQDVIAAHAESLSNPVYPAPDVFRMRKGYVFPELWDFSLDAANTAFLYMPDMELKEYYVRSAFSFMRSLEGAEVDPVVSMCFAEQRLLPMCAGAKRRRIHYLFSCEEMFSQELVTHVWGYKRVLAGSSAERDKFCCRCVRRIQQEFPEWVSMLAANRRTRQYLSEVRSHVDRR